MVCKSDLVRLHDGVPLSTIIPQNASVAFSVGLLLVCVSSIVPTPLSVTVPCFFKWVCVPLARRDLLNEDSQEGDRGANDRSGRFSSAPNEQIG